MFLTEGKGQALCSLEESTGYNCYAECENEKTEQLKWFALPCGQAGQVECDKAILANRKAGGGIGNQQAAQAAAGKAADDGAAKRRKAEEEQAEAERKKKAEAEAAAAKEKEESAQKARKALGYDPKDVIDLRGLNCELLDGVERCFMEDEQGRELCPPSVTSEWLTNPTDQYLCSSEMTTQYYCTVGCQDGNDEIRWGAHEISWCDKPENKGGWLLECCCC